MFNVLENNFGMVDLANYEDSLLLLAMGFGISDLLIVHKLLLLMKINLTEVCIFHFFDQFNNILIHF